MSQDLGQEFLKGYHPVRRVPQIFGGGNDVKPSDNVQRKQSDVSITSNRSNTIFDYGLGSMSRYKHPDLSTIAQSEIITATSGEWADNESSLGTAEDLNADAEDSRESVETLLNDAALEAEGNAGYEWLPASALGEICRPSTVFGELKRHFNTSEAELYTKYVCGDLNDTGSEGDSSRRIFAILVLITKVEELPRFVRAEVRDEHLPFLWVDNKSRNELYSKQFSRTDKNPLSCFGRKDLSLMKRFYQTQWQVLVPFFTRDSADEVNVYQLHNHTIMPWTDFIGKEKESGFSQVRCVKIHEAHHSFHEHKSFALKTLLQDNPKLAAKEFRSELHVFIKMKPEKHLLELCAAFVVEHKGFNQYSFLFPWADGGSLENLWTKRPSNLLPNQSVSVPMFLQWIAEQFHGLAGALHSIHDVRVQALKRTKLEEAKREEEEEYYGIHGDIKPENILHFSQISSPNPLGVLKIADFGLTDFHTLRSRTTEMHINIPVLAPTYQAPELKQPGEYFSRKADIWSLGCVFSQFVTWAISGVESVKDFDRRRQLERDYDHRVKAVHRFYMDTFYKAEFFPGGRVETSLKTATREWIQGLHDLVQSGPVRNFLSDFCQLLLDQMLVAKRDKRIGCEELVTELGKLANASGIADDRYWNPSIPTFSHETVSEYVSSDELPVLTLNDGTEADYVSHAARTAGHGGRRRVSFDTTGDTKS